MKSKEASLQAGCVSWFYLQYPQYKGLLIAVPNGGSRRNAIEGYNLKRTGVVAGTADLLLLISRKGYGCLCIEMKYGKGRQSPSQKEWEAATTKGGNLYTVCRSLDEFMNCINTYLT